MRPERASHSSRVSRLVAKHVKVLIVGTGGQRHVFFSAARCTAARRSAFFTPTFKNSTFSALYWSSFSRRSGSARRSCNAYPFAGWLPRPEEWPQNEVAGTDSSSLSHALLVHSLRTAASHTVLRRTTNEHTIAFEFSVTYRSVLYWTYC
jgi:hypothetical protein